MCDFMLEIYGTVYKVLSTNKEVDVLEFQNLVVAYHIRGVKIGERNGKKTWISKKQS